MILFMGAVGAAAGAALLTEGLGNIALKALKARLDERDLQRAAATALNAHASNARLDSLVSPTPAVDFVSQTIPFFKRGKDGKLTVEKEVTILMTSSEIEAAAALEGRDLEFFMLAVTAPSLQGERARIHNMKD
jgi:hypothetical protein